MQKRVYGIDLLRIISMYMIMALHTMSNGGGLLYHQVNTWHTQVILLLTFLNNIAVNLFAIISGYVGLHSHHRTSRIVELWLQVIFYSWSIMIFFYFWKPDLLPHSQIIGSLFPTLSMQYWYFNSYLLLFVFIPLLNSGINKLSHRQFRSLCLGLFLLTSCCGALFFNDVFKLSNGFSGIWLIILYLYGAYIKKYGECLKKISIKQDLAGYVVVSLIGVLICNIMVLHSSGYHNGSVLYHMWFKWFAYNTPFAVIGAIFVFLAFLRVKVQKNWLRKLIIKLGSLAFGTYLLQTNYIVYAWFKGFYRSFYSQNIITMVVLILLTAFAWYMLGTMIDWVRSYIFRKLSIVSCVMRGINFLSGKLKAKFHFVTSK